MLEENNVHFFPPAIDSDVHSLEKCHTKAIVWYFWNSFLWLPQKSLEIKNDRKSIAKNINMYVIFVKDIVIFCFLNSSCHSYIILEP